jgi:hypothetical protein
VSITDGVICRRFLFCRILLFVLGLGVPPYQPGRLEAVVAVFASEKVICIAATQIELIDTQIMSVTHLYGVMLSCIHICLSRADF